jgi:hypothetical protein
MNEIRRVQELAVQLPDVIELASSIEAVKRNPGKAAAVAGIGTAVGFAGTAIGINVHRQMKKQREFQKTAGEGDVMQIARDLYVDRHGAMFPANHPKVLSANLRKSRE